jgi:hypothetical protein
MRPKPLHRQPMAWGVAILALFLFIQAIPVERNNPPVTERIEAPPEVQTLLRRACMDCHSNETFWPWYSGVAPISWLTARDVREGREHLNLSTWDRYDAGERAELFDEMAEVVEEGEMPMKMYLPLHPEARLTAEERALLVRWARAGGGG